MRFFAPKNKIEELIEMEKKFNKFKNEIDPDELFEVITDPFYNIYISKLPSEYDETPTESIVPKHITGPKIVGLSRKRRRQVQTPSATVSLIQLLMDQLVIIV